ncbi:hypothetical protein Ddye_014642 [Dipteronia dyeriana]|uniref:F-box domain-containing protein n=1 Tax=Dipteronia dyeriana TaxID=168575 RepID=A0AAD9X8R1_9ROSI|nr:hypothetical protein Ddye_014642 [Dipteronia dyeriana]
MDRISELSDFTIHHIMSYLSAKEIMISSDRLKRLSISSCIKLKEIEIDTPYLLSLHYRNHPILTSKVNVPRLWRLHFINAADELGNKVDPDVQWFLNMKQFLGASNRIELLSINVKSKRDSFNLEEFRNCLSSLPCEVEKLWLLLDAPPSSFAALLDGLLGIGYPREFSLIIKHEVHHNFVEWLYKEMMNRDDNCCNSRNIKCWRHYLKDFKIKGFHFLPSFDSLSFMTLDLDAVMDLLPKLPNGILQCRMYWCFPESLELMRRFVTAEWLDSQIPLLLKMNFSL